MNLNNFQTINKKNLDQLAKPVAIICLIEIFMESCSKEILH